MGNLIAGLIFKETDSNRDKENMIIYSIGFSKANSTNILDLQKVPSLLEAGIYLQNILKLMPKTGGLQIICLQYDLIFIQLIIAN